VGGGEKREKVKDENKNVGEERERYIVDKREKVGRKRQRKTEIVVKKEKWEKIETDILEKREKHRDCREERERQIL
jgi:hypothetical protein